VKSKKIDFTVMEIFVLTPLFMCAPLRETINPCNLRIAFISLQVDYVHYAATYLEFTCDSGAYSSGVRISSIETNRLQ